jgi:alpha-glucosidase (family GH31 glycosyl hydrolase)
MRNGSASGAFLLNSNGMDVVVAGDGAAAGSLSFRTIGGVIDLFIFVGPQPEDVVAQYHAIVGVPAMPPMWALGWHQCRWGYETIDDVKVGFSASMARSRRPDGECRGDADCGRAVRGEQHPTRRHVERH